MVHRGHPEGNSGTYNQSVDKRIIDKVYNLVARGIARPDEVKRCIDEYVERELLPNIPAAVRPRKSNGKYYPTWRDLRNQEAFLAMFQRVAYSRSKKQFEEALMTLRNPNVYRDNVKVRDYVKKIWMPCVKCWAHVYWNQEAVNIVNTNNGVEAQNKYFKDNYLPRSVDKSVYAIVVMLVEYFLPDLYQHYIETNIKQSNIYRRYSNDVLNYLHNRPSHFIKHSMKSRFAAGTFRESDVECLNFAKGKFKVKSSSKSQLYYIVDLQIPRCTCEAWLKSRFPCKHFFCCIQRIWWI